MTKPMTVITSYSLAMKTRFLIVIEKSAVITSSITSYRVVVVRVCSPVRVRVVVVRVCSPVRVRIIIVTQAGVS